MYILFFVLWVIFNGRITLEITIFGLVISACMYWFICKFMDYSIKKEIRIFKRAGYMVEYLWFLVVEIVKANFTTMKLMLSSDYVAEPAIIHFQTNLKTNMGRCLLANSITLTPGTITVSLEDDEYTVHCLDKELAQGIDSSIFVRLLEGIERVH